MVLLDPKKITQFIVDATNACDKECLADVTKASITDKTILTQSELESLRNSIWLSTAWNNSIYVQFPYMYITQALLCIYTNKLERLRKQCTVPLNTNVITVATIQKSTKFIVKTLYL